MKIDIEKFRDKNNIDLYKNIIFTFLIKGGAMFVSILMVPAYTKYFDNNDAYGSWLTISSVFLWINMFDFGIGNGLRNYLVKSISQKDNISSKKYISSSYISVGILSLILMGIGTIVIVFFNWNDVLHISEHLIRRSIFIGYVEIVYIGVVLHFFFLLISSICYALQKTYLPGLFSLITQCLILCFLWIPSAENLENKMINLSIVHLLAYNIPILIVTLYLFGGKLKVMKPSFKYFRRDTSKEVMKLGGSFFLIQIALIALNSSNEIYINTFFKPSDVVEYSYYYKLFYILMVINTLYLQPIWSAITKAFYEKRYKWIKKILISSFIIGLLLSISSFILGISYQFIVDIWLGKDILIVNLKIIMLFAIFTSFNIMANIINAFSNGLGRLKCQSICTFLGAFIKLIVIILMRKMSFDVGWPIIMWANIIALVPMIIFHPIYIFKYINNIIEKDKSNRI